ncbi:MAG: GNAT family N-acetyltransferase [Myxococcaceae bacterium]
MPLSTRLLTERYLLRPPGPGDVRAIAAAMKANEAHLERWSPTGAFGPAERTAARVAQRILRDRRDWRRDVRCSLLVLERRRPRAMLGQIGLTVQRGIFQNGYVGYWTDRNEQGKGLITECLRATVSFAFGPLGLHRLQAAVIPTNAASLRVLEKLGFRTEGYAKRYLKIAGSWQDHVITAITGEEWKG